MQVTVDLVVRAIIKYSNVNALFLRVYGVYARASERLRKLKRKKERKERKTKRGKGLAAESEKRRWSASLLALEPRPATTTAHDRAHKREEAVGVFCWRHRTDLVLYIAQWV